MIATLPTSNGSQGNRIELDVIELFLVIHLKQETTHLLSRQRHALSSSNLDYALLASL